MSKKNYSSTISQNYNDNIFISQKSTNSTTNGNFDFLLNSKENYFFNEKPIFSDEIIKFYQEEFQIKDNSAEYIFEEIFYELTFKMSKAFFIMKFKVKHK